MRMIDRPMASPPMVPSFFRPRFGARLIALRCATALWCFFCDRHNVYNLYNLYNVYNLYNLYNLYNSTTSLQLLQPLQPAQLRTV